MTLTQELASLLNRYSAENTSNTPDFILAEYMMSCLVAFDHAVSHREDWYGHRHEPGRMGSSCVPSCHE